MTKCINSPKELFKLAYKMASNLKDENANSFAADLPHIDKLSVHKLTPSLLPITNAMKSIGSTAKSTVELVTAIKNAYKLQAWRQPYLEKDIGSTFTNGSAWFPIADVNGPIVYNKGLVEIMLLNKGITYPKHSHSPEELYIVLAGQVWWEAEGGANSPCWKKAGDVIHHSPNQVHAITAGEEAVLILNFWRGGAFEMPSIT
ncbi:dimethylsulfonioproprionate lyase family protein [Sulfurospirillum arcachonense]|uniref:dimethylsulfonioproprionate lyase family protein n=1 Tax=Sulfurospirillum arcachonense TaxID=57666 RepID=UPI00046AA8BB|nr:dimethylsulfonioproprionate lyase family protein [Sulfurospirillum arcachonense]